MRGWTWKFDRAVSVPAGQEHAAAALEDIANQLVNACAGLIGLTEDEQREIGTDERHRSVAKLGGAEGFRMKSAGLLEFERSFLCNSESRPAADDVKAGRIPEAVEQRRPVALPG